MRVLDVSCSASPFQKRLQEACVLRENTDVKENIPTASGDIIVPSLRRNPSELQLVAEAA